MGGGGRGGVGKVVSNISKICMCGVTGIAGLGILEGCWKVRGGKNLEGGAAWKGRSRYKAHYN